MSTLYRKYRPQKWAEVVNQNHVKITLQHEIEREQIAHAYLFTGPRGVGKTTVARVMAKSLNCDNRAKGESEPCTECETCLSIQKGRSLDIIEIDAASHTGVDNVRENIINAARVAPTKDKYKVFIIDEVHMLSLSAFNALLKVLEEPPQNVIFILATTEVHKIPETIISRTQRFDFKRISIADISRKLNYIATELKIQIDQEILDAIARQSEGHMRDAESLLGQVVAIGGAKITKEEADLVIPRSDIDEALNLIGFIAQKDPGSGIGLINKIIDDGVDLKRFVRDTIELLRKILLIKVNPRLGDHLGLELGENFEIKVNEISATIDQSLIIKSIEKLQIVLLEIKTSFITQLPVEIALVSLAEAEKKSPITNNTFQKATPNPQSAPKAPFIQPPVLNETVDASPELVKSSGKEVTKDEVKAKWNEVLAKVKKYNHSLSFVLRVCQPRGIKGNAVCLAFKYKFHKDRVNEVNIKQIVEKVLSEVYGTNLTVEAIIDENITTDSASSQTPPAPAQGGEQKTDNAAIDNLLKTFGGKVVD